MYLENNVTSIKSQSECLIVFLSVEDATIKSSNLCKTSLIT